MLKAQTLVFKKVKKKLYCFFIYFFSYEFIGFDWHWGTVSTQGSEHTIDGKKYAAEVHVALFNTKYDVMKICSAEDCGAILAFLFEVRIIKTRMTISTKAKL